MNTFIVVAAFSLSLSCTGCSAGPPVTSPTQAPTGFDNKSNGVADDPTHQADQASFEQFEAIPDGLGPLFNAQSCRECHLNPVAGGASQVLELRVGHKGRDGTFQNPDIPINGGSVIIKGRTLVNQRAICPNAAFPTTDIQERVPDSETIRTFRISVNLLGDGFVEAVDDSTLIEISRKQCHKDRGQICGLVLYVPVLESPGVTRVGRFGWKNQHASLLSFSGDAYLNEIGITNRLSPDEVTDLCNTVAEPNDKPGADGLTDLDHFARFMRATKAPARDARQAATAAARKGETLFASVGCDSCHVPTLTTAAAGTVVNGGKFTIPGALGNKTFHPYSDFLLHDIETGDGIVQAGPQDTANKLRTAALWGLRTRPRYMHDLRSLTLHNAIERHQGEAEDVTRRFHELTEAEKQQLVTFLNSL